MDTQKSLIYGLWTLLVSVAISWHVEGLSLLETNFAIWAKSICQTGTGIYWKPTIPGSAAGMINCFSDIVTESTLLNEKQNDRLNFCECLTHFTNPVSFLKLTSRDFQTFLCVTYSRNLWTSTPSQRRGRGPPSTRAWLHKANSTYSRARPKNDTSRTRLSELMRLQTTALWITDNSVGLFQIHTEHNQIPASSCTAKLHTKGAGHLL